MKQCKQYKTGHFKTTKKFYQQVDGWSVGFMA